MRRSLLVLLSLASSAALAAPPKLAALTKVYADKHGLPVRVVQRDLGTRQIERHFVPVLPATHDDFLNTFQIGQGAIVWRASRDAVHPVISLSPGQALHYYSPARSPAAAQAVFPHLQGGHYLTLAVDEPEVKHWEGMLKPHVGGDKTLSMGGLTYKMPGTNIIHGGCMWWLVHAELAPNLNLATAMGVRRAKGPEVLAPRLIHAGNERVGPIGIPVATIEDFNKMTDDQLLGPEPAGGAAEQVKQ